MKRKVVPYPLYTPLIWSGMRFSHWMGLLAKNGFGIHPSRIPAAVAVTLFSLSVSVTSGISEKTYRKEIEKTKIEKPPVFILGFPRSGTTYMHELLSVDRRFTAPSTYQCLAANHFLLTEPIFGKLIGKVIPKRRPTDEMKLGWDRPQEDEFALCNLGLPSPFHAFAFPKTICDLSDCLDMRNLTDEELQRWKEGLVKFLKMATLRRPGRLVLKSPTHTGRIATLAEIFPKARFIRMVRDPYASVPSALFLWEVLCRQQGLQKFESESVEELVFDALIEMDRSYEQGAKSLGPSCLFELRYEDLIADPRKALRKTYRFLDLDGFEDCEKRLETFLSDNKPYRPKPYAISPELREKISKRFAGFRNRYGYPVRYL